MELEEYNLILQKNNFDMEDFYKCLSFLALDAKGDATHIKAFYDLVFSARTIKDITPLIELHKLAKEYIKKNEENPDIWQIYILELEYYFYVDCPAEVLKYANRILVLTGEDVDKTEAYTYAMMIFFRLKLYKEALSYLDETEIYLKNSQVSTPREFEVLLNELDILAASKLLKRYDAIKARVLDILKDMYSKPYYEAAKTFFDIHDLYGMVMLKDELQIDKDLLLKRFKELLSTLINYTYVTENYATLFIPLFTYFKDGFNEEEYIESILKILKYRLNVSERVLLYSYLVEELKIDRFKYPDIYQEYINNLCNYFKVSLDNKVSEVNTEILNFSLEKKLDVISAKYHYDQLTGCYNRVFLSEIEERVLEPGDAIIYMDLNDFKKINDTYGHETGDNQLKIFAKILLNHFKDDIVLRLGGDEFVVLTRGLPEDILAKIDLARAEYLTHNILKNRYGFSCGVLFGKGIMLHEAIGLADMAMYDSKNTGLPLCLKEV